MKKRPYSHNPVLFQVLRSLKNLLDDFDSPWILIGGVAAAILGKPRFTADVDAVVLLENDDIPEFINKAKKYGLLPRISNAEEFAKKNRVILLKHISSGIGLDISMGMLSFEVEAVKNSRSIKVGGISVRLPRAEDLIIFKAVAHRPQDMLDIQEIIKLNKTIDKKYLQRCLEEFSAILEKPFIWEDIKKLLRK